MYHTVILLFTAVAVIHFDKSYTLLFQEIIQPGALLHSETTIFLRLLDRVFSFQNNPKDLDLSCKMDLDLWDCLGRVKLVL